MRVKLDCSCGRTGDHGALGRHTAGSCQTDAADHQVVVADVALIPERGGQEGVGQVRKEVLSGGGVEAVPGVDDVVQQAANAWESANEALTTP